MKRLNQQRRHKRNQRRAWKVLIGISLGVAFVLFQLSFFMALISFATDNESSNNDDHRLSSSQREHEKKLLLADSSFYKSVTHRGGWKTVLAYLISRGIVVDETGIRNTSYAYAGRSDEDADSTLLFLDITEKHFLWEQRGVISRPWAGILHLATDLPGHYPEYLRLETLLHRQEFQESLAHCTALILLANDAAEFVRHSLHSRGGHDGVKVCSLFHPITVENSEMNNKVTKLHGQSVAYQGIVFLGQQYRRLATMHQFQNVNLPKIWLPGMPIDSKAHRTVERRMKRELRLAGATMDRSLQVTYTSDQREYDALLRENIVVIDLWAATANNAVLEVIAMDIPAFIRRLPSTEQYIGSDYPLFFSGLEELSSKLGYSNLTTKLLPSGHDYLRQIDKRRYSLDNFAQGIGECVRIEPKSSTDGHVQ